MSESLATASILSSVSDELANTVERAGAAVVTVDARRRHPPERAHSSSHRVSPFLPSSIACRLTAIVGRRFAVAPAS